MLAMQLVAPRKFETLDIPNPQLEAGKVIFRPALGSICGSDWYTVNHGRNYDTFPLPIGRPIHEVTGIVEQSDHPDYQPGDRVLDVGYAGGLREFHLCDPNLLVKLPESPSLDELLMSQPLGVVAHAAHKWPNLLGSSGVVMGQGAIGQFHTAMLKLAGVAPLIAIDKEEGRLALSRKMGATHTINASKEDAVQAVLDLTGGQGADTVVEAVGLEDTYNQVLSMVRKGGSLTFFGLPKLTPMSFDMLNLIRHDVTIVAPNQGERDADFTLARDLIASGRVYVHPLITHKLPVGEILQAFRLAESRADNVVKIVLEF